MAMAMTTAMAKAKEEVSYADPSLVLDKEQICSFALLRGMEIEKEEEQAKEEVSYAAPSVGLVLDKEQICSFAELRGMEIEKEEQLKPESGLLGMKNVSNIERLQGMLRNMEFMERILHSDASLPPTLAMRQLYGLIIRHVKHCILMFYIERGSTTYDFLCCDKPSSPTDRKDVLMHRLLKVYCCKDSFINRGCPSSGEQVQQRVTQVQELFNMFNGILRKNRKTLAEYAEFELSLELRKDFMGSCIPSDAEKMKAKEDETVDQRHVCLAAILQGLEEMGRARVYAPPGDEEIGLYQEIRKRSTSCLEFMKAKPRWQSYIRKWYSTEEDHGIQSWTWNSFHRGPSFPGVLYAPNGYQLAIVLDEFHDFLSIIRECKCHFLDIYPSLLEKSMFDGLDPGGDENTEAPSACSIPYGREKRKFDDLSTNPVLTTEVHDVAAANEKKVNKFARGQYLQTLSQLLKKMGPLTSDTRLKVEESRLYGQIVEHVTSSIWMYETIMDGTSRPDRNSAGDACGLFRGCSMSAVEEIPTSREQCLMKMVQLVESIRSSFMGVPPTEQEIALYKEIEAQLNIDLLNPRPSCLIQGPTFKGMYEKLLRFVYDQELFQIKKLKEALGEIVRIFYGEHFDCSKGEEPLDLLEEYYCDYDLRELVITPMRDRIVTHTRMEVLDRLILISTKMMVLFESFLRSRAAAHEHIDSLVACGADDGVGLEVSGSLQVLLQNPTSPNGLKNFWGCCRAREVLRPSKAVDS